MMSCSLFSKWFSKNSAYILTCYYHIALYYKSEIVVNHCCVFFFTKLFLLFFLYFLIYLFSFLLTILDCEYKVYSYSLYSFSFSVCLKFFSVT